MLQFKVLKHSIIGLKGMTVLLPDNTQTQERIKLGLIEAYDGEDVVEDVVEDIDPTKETNVEIDVELEDDIILDVDVETKVVADIETKTTKKGKGSK